MVIFCFLGRGEEERELQFFNLSRSVQFLTSFSHFQYDFCFLFFALICTLDTHFVAKVSSGVHDNIKRSLRSQVVTRRSGFKVNHDMTLYGHCDCTGIATFHEPIYHHCYQAQYLHLCGRNITPSTEVVS